MADGSIGASLAETSADSTIVAVDLIRKLIGCAGVERAYWRSGGWVSASAELVHGGVARAAVSLGAAARARGVVVLAMAMRAPALGKPMIGMTHLAIETIAVDCHANVRENSVIGIGIGKGIGIGFGIEGVDASVGVGTVKH